VLIHIVEKVVNQLAGRGKSALIFLFDQTKSSELPELH
jgi:hypothetical protein